MSSVSYTHLDVYKRQGAHYGAYAPLGYVKDPDKKGHLLIDTETRWIVEKIFDLAVHGRGAASITPVSYTHLDVYKRQSLGLCGVIFFLAASYQSSFNAESMARYWDMKYGDFKISIDLDVYKRQVY